MSPDVTRRLFVAIFPPESALAHLGLAVDDLEMSRGATAARLVPRIGWHVTLAYLGPVPPEQLPDAGSAVARAVQRRATQRGSTGGTQSRGTQGRGTQGRGERVSGGELPGGAPLRLWLAGGGTFGTGERQILWAGLAGDLVGLHDLAEVVRAELTAVGLATDPREFRPHLTISRPGATISADLVAADAARLDPYIGPLWIADAVELVAVDAVGGEAVRGEAGPRSRYIRLAAVPL